MQLCTGTRSRRLYKLKIETYTEIHIRTYINSIYIHYIGVYIGICVCVCVSPFTESPLASASWLNSNTQNLYMQQLYSKTKHDAPRQPSLRVPSEPIDIQYIEYFDPTYTEPYANASIFRHIYYIYIPYKTLENPCAGLLGEQAAAASPSPATGIRRGQELASGFMHIYIYGGLQFTNICLGFNLSTYTPPYSSPYIQAS